MKRADEILAAGAKHLADRAATRDQPEGERSMARAVAAFNAMYGKGLTVEQGGQFMVLLKMARSAAGAFNLDDYEDGAAYFALAAEDAYRERVKPEPTPCAPSASGPIKWRDGAKWLGINADGEGMFFSERPVFKEDDGRQVNFWNAPRGETLTWDAGYFDPEQYRRGREGLYERYVEPLLSAANYDRPLPDGVTWADAPEWAQWFALAPDGWGYWFAGQPRYADGGWYGDQQMVAKFKKPKDASRTLRRRPPTDSGQSELPAQD